MFFCAPVMRSSICDFILQMLTMPSHSSTPFEITNSFATAPSGYFTVCPAVKSASGILSSSAISPTPLSFAIAFVSPCPGESPNERFLYPFSSRYSATPRKTSGCVVHAFSGGHFARKFGLRSSFSSFFSIESTPPIRSIAFFAAAEASLYDSHFTSATFAILLLLCDEK